MFNDKKSDQVNPSPKWLYWISTGWPLGNDQQASRSHQEWSGDSSGKAHQESGKNSEWFVF